MRCILRDDDRFVLVRHSYGDRRWMLPGGRMRSGEEPVETAQREMYQELGVTCEGWRVVGLIAARRGYWRRSAMDAFRRHSTVYVEGDVRTATLAPRRGELSHAGWFAPRTLPDERSDSLDFVASRGWLERPPLRRGFAR